MMTRLRFLIFTLVLASSPASADRMGKNDIGLGLMLGSMHAVTGKYWISEQGAIDFGIGFNGRNALALYGDFLWHVPGIFGSGTKFGRETSGYLGGGAGVGTWNDSYDCGRWKCNLRREDSGTGVFLRALFGFEWFPARTRFGVFAELGPTLLLAPDTGGSLDIGLGGRYYF